MRFITKDWIPNTFQPVHKRADNPNFEAFGPLNIQNSHAFVNIKYDPSERLANLPETEQNNCYNTPGNVINYFDTCQNGETQAGKAWPDLGFTDIGDATMVDNLTGLMWLKYGSCLKKTSWLGALDNLACVNSNLENRPCVGYTGSHNDYALPNVNELDSLIHVCISDTALYLSGDRFVNVACEMYWT